MRRRQRGFTLVEGMVSLAILAVITLAMGGTFLVAYRAISTEARVIAENALRMVTTITASKAMATVVSMSVNPRRPLT